MPPSSLPANRGLALVDLVGTLGGGLLTVAVAPATGNGPDAPAAEVDDVTLAEPGAGVFGQAGDLLLGVAVEDVDVAVDLIANAARVGSGGVVLRRGTARRREVRAAARKAGMPLVELADHASWAHIVWLLRSVLDRAATGDAVRSDGAVHDDLFALADACAALVDAPVTIEDTQSRVLAHSARQDAADPVRLSTIVGRKVPDAVLASLRGRGVFRRLATSAEPFFVPADKVLNSRLVVPVRAGDEWLGSIWAVVDEPPEREVIRSLTQTASVVALHLLRLRSQADLSRRLAAERLRNLLSGNVIDAEGWLPPAPWRVVVLAGDPTMTVDSRLDTWESACRRASWRHPLLATLDDHVVAIVRDSPEPALTPSAAASPGTWQWLTAVAADIAETRPHARASAGSAVSTFGDLLRSRREALEVHRLGAGRAVTVEAAWAGVTCERALSGIRTLELLGPVGELTAHDAEHGTDFAATLAAWLDHPGDPQSAARALHVHPNTLRYRMQRLPLDADLTDPEVRLALRLQLRALGH